MMGCMMVSDEGKRASLGDDHALIQRFSWNAVLYLPRGGSGFFRAFASIGESTSDNAQ
jgi:hypothetical protein